MPRCKACRSTAYRLRRYPTSCSGCDLNCRLDSNGRCAQCNAKSGLRVCRGACKELLPIALCFYSHKARCKECLRRDKERRSRRGGGRR